MDALKALAGQQGCSVDGTSAVARNPMSSFVNQLGKDGISAPRRQQHHHKQHQQEMDAAISQGMARNQAQQGGMNMNAMQAPQMMQADAMTREFQAMNQGGGNAMFQQAIPSSQQNMAMANDWVQQFDQMNVGLSQVPSQAQRSQQFMPQQAQMMPQYQQQYMPQQMGMNMNHMMGQRWGGQMPMMPRGYAPGPMQSRWAPPRQQMAAPTMQQVSQQPMETQTYEQQADLQEDSQMQDSAEPVQDSDALRKATEDLVNVMSSDPKFKESNFYQEMSKVAKGESVITENEIKQVKEDPLGKYWNDDQLEELLGDPNTTTEDIRQMFERAYQQDMNHFAQGAELGPMFDQPWSVDDGGNKTYELQQDNKFARDQKHDEDSLFDLGMHLFQRGELKEAILAFEAVLDKDITNAEAWRMLGVIHQESDEDRKAIMCLESAVEQDPYNLPALLCLGVSYVNELDQRNALKNLKAWVDNNPRFAGIKVNDIYGDDSGDLMHDVMMLMTKVEEFAPADPDVQEVLGVLFNVSRDYDQAVGAFRKALSHKPDDYSLWNKLGATLANSSKSSEALPIYTRALELKPRYARGWLNFGISHSNLGEYQKAIRAYLRALDLNPDASHIWNYLRICLTCLDGYDHLLPEIEKRNFSAMKQAFDV